MRWANDKNSFFCGVTCCYTVHSDFLHLALGPKLGLTGNSNPPFFAALPEVFAVSSPTE